MIFKYLKINLLCCFLVLGCRESNFKEKVIDQTILNSNKDQTKEFFYVAKNQERIDIYKYNFEKKNSKRFWTDIKEKVILLNYSPDNKNIYFITSKYYGIRSTLPYIKRIKLYKIDLANEEVSLIDTLMNGTQLNADWLNDNAFQVVINVRDLQVSEHMNQNTFIYNDAGKKVLYKLETINFIKDGYPLPVIREQAAKSFKNFELQVKGQNKDSLFIFNHQTLEQQLVTKLNKSNLEEISWNDEYLIFTITGKKKIMIIYKLKKKQIVKQFNDIRNFYVFGKYLVYDFNVGLSSSISIFNLEKLEITDTIKTIDGCGLRNTFN